MATTIHLNPNGDAVGEIELLKKLMKENTGYTWKDFSAREIVEIALDELYGKLVAEKKAGKNQRKL